MIVGLDLSLNAAGVVCIPNDWEWGQWDRVEAETILGKKLGKGFEKAASVARSVSVLCAGADFVGIEGYAFSKSSASVTRLAELGGAVRMLLVQSFVRFGTVQPNTARARLSKFPSSGAKLAVRAWLEKHGLPAHYTLDESDALVIAMWAQEEWKNGKTG